MMIIIAITIISVLALLTDLYIYLRFTKRYKVSRVWKWVYVIYAVLIDTAVITSLLVHRTAADPGNTATLRATMWVIGLFFLHAAPKMLYAVISLGDYIVQLFTRKKSRVFGIIGVIAGLIVAIIMIHGMSFGRSDIRVTRVDLTFEDLPQAFDGIRVVHFSDTHLGTIVNRDKFIEKLADTINDLRPDIIINSGDIVNTHVSEFDQKAVDVFKRLSATYGVFSVLGNHDLGMYLRDTVMYPPKENVRQLIAIQRSMGWNFLSNETVFVKEGDDSISISGINYPDGYRHNGHNSSMVGADVATTYQYLDDGIFNITISHAPQLWDEILEAGKADLTLSGHVHSMQVKLHFGKRQWSPAEFMYDRWSGLYQIGKKYLYINDGTGYVMYPMRVGTKPEVTLYVLHSK